ncbi:MAG: ribosomal protein L7/L12, partial [Bacteroidales bacterium]|nr:ribosomal protein L7/L12 [Bacteroidales bacterium]
KFDIRLTNAGTRKLAVIRRIKQILMLGLKEAKDIINSAPYILIENITIEQAEDIQIDLENLGATINII